ncbi:LacI family DNA-binding transcriptional regulator [Micromonospora sp. CPCC 205558]|uniref:LacI family DNA-binding transcriptional regulator n=1 Tax=Micromonospora sp. CPCC 205558 TaxID=3122403 RepID=UPI003FA5E630
MTQTPTRPTARRRPTMVDVARRADVSLKTVSRVVNDEPVGQELVGRVLAAIAELGFRRNDIARNLRSRQLNATVGLLIEEIANPFYATIASVAAEIAAAHGTMLITASSEEDPERERALLQDFTQRRVDGLLVVPAGLDHSFLRREVELGMPVVFLDRPPQGLQADAVLLDNRGGSHTAVSALLGEGHRRVGLLLGAPSVPTMRERLAGARAALDTAGVEPDESLVRERLIAPEEAGRAVATLLDLPKPPTAFFCANNRLTVGALQELHRRGSDAALVGFDDFELAHLMPRPLTVVAYDTRELARVATERLFQRIAGDDTPPSTTVLPTTLLKRGLTP